MRKGHTGAQIVTVLNNDGRYGHKRTLTLSANETGFTANEKLVDVVSCGSLTADSSGNVTVTINEGAPLVLYPAANLDGSVICTISGDGTSTDVSDPETRYHVGAAARGFATTSLTALLPIAGVLLAALY